MTAVKNFRISSFVASAAIKAPVDTETTANITLSGLQTVNGVVLAAGDRVLVKDQTDQKENGIWVVDTSAWERASDWDGARDATNGTVVIVARSTIVALWQMTTTSDPFIPGEHNCTFGVLTSVDTLSRLADTATGEGASLIGLEDAAANFAATTVEAALAELFGTPSQTARRLLELATAAEIDAGTDSTRAIGIDQIIASASFGIETGNFVTPAWSGFTTSPTTNWIYRRFGEFLHIKAQASLLATSNATTCTLAAFAIPSDYRVFGESFFNATVQDNGTWQHGMIQFDSDGSVTLHAGADPTTGGFTASGQKGLMANRNWTYRLT